MKKLLQLAARNAGRGMPLRADATPDTLTLYVYDVIGADWGGVDEKAFVQAIEQFQGAQIIVRINSPGGDVFAGRAMAAAIGRTSAKVTAAVDGVAASAATVVATAADQVVMAQGAFWMIHNAWTVAIGNRNDLMDTAALLEQVDGSLAADYARRTGMALADVQAAMDAETWYSAEDAVAAKFADSIDEGKKASAKWDLSAYNKAPKLNAPDPSEITAAQLHATLERRLRLIEAVPA